MKQNEYRFTTKLWEYEGDSPWFFATLPRDQAAEIKHLFGTPWRGWGSVKVEASIGKTVWMTSIFPDKESASYVLPVKSTIRKAEGITAGSKITVMLRIRR